VEYRSYPIAALQHLAGNLGIARLVGADQADDLQACKEEKCAECDKG
jgi:hypothetical protein